MSCAAFTFLGVYVVANNKSNSWALGATFGMALFMLLVASFLAWRDEYKKRLALANPPEKPDSLRRRTVRLADEIQEFYAARRSSRPPLYLNSEGGCDSSGRTKDQITHDSETVAQCSSKFGKRIVAIAQELQARGISAEVHVGSGMLVGDTDRAPSLEELQLLKCLAYQIDHQDIAVRF